MRLSGEKRFLSGNYFLFFAFHVLFLGFNVYYFMSKSNDSLENEIGLGENSNEVADIDTQI